MNNPLLNPGLGTFVWMLLEFGILTFILIKFGWPMIIKSLKDREHAIEDSLHAADKAKEEMRQLQCKNEELLRQARRERDEMLRHARLTSDQIIEDAKFKAQADADRIRQNAVESIQFEKQKALTDLKNEIATLSIEIAEKLIRQELSDKQKANDLIERELEHTEL